MLERLCCSEFLPNTRHPPPSGIRPSFLMSTWTRSPAAAARGAPARVRDAAREPLGGSGVGPAFVDDEPGQTQPTGRSEEGVSVGHEDVRGGKWVRGCSTPHPEVFVWSSRPAVPNVRG